MHIRSAGVGERNYRIAGSNNKDQRCAVDDFLHIDSGISFSQLFVDILVSPDHLGVIINLTFISGAKYDIEVFVDDDDVIHRVEHKV